MLERWNRLKEGLPRPYWALLAGTFINRLGTFVVPLLFVYLTQQRGLSLVLAGQVAALHGLGSMLGTLFGGALADRVGRRVTMLGSLMLGALVMLGLGLAREVWALGLATFLLGLTGDAFRPASQALVADVVPDAHRFKAFTMQYWVINLGFTFAAVMGGLMAKQQFSLLFMLDAATSLAMAAIVFRLVPESRAAVPVAGQPEAQGSWLTPFVDRRFNLFLLLNLVMGVVFFQHLTGLPEDMHEKGLDTADFGLAVAVNGLLIVLLQPSVAQWTAKLRPERALALGSLATGVGFGLTALASTLPGYMLSVAVWTVGEMIFAPVNATYVAKVSPPHMRGRYQGAFTISWSISALISPSTMPWVMQQVGLPVFWVGCAVVGGLVALVHVTFTARSLSRGTTAG